MPKENFVRVRVGPPPLARGAKKTVAFKKGSNNALQDVQSPTKIYDAKAPNMKNIE